MEQSNRDEEQHRIKHEEQRKIRHEELRRKVVKAIADTMDLYGATPSFGELYGIMYFEDKPMTLEEMKNRMNMSKSNMSYAVRSLMASQMVSKLEEKRDRRDLYQAETNFFLAFQNFFTIKLQREINVMTEAINEVLPELTEIILDLGTPEEERQLCLEDVHKLRHALNYYTWLQQFVYDLREGRYFDENANIEPVNKPEPDSAN